MARVLRGLFSLAVIALVGVAAFLYFYLTQPIPLSEEKIVLIERGAGRMEIAQTLEKQGIIEYPKLFAVLSRILNKPIFAGEYIFEPGMQTKAVLSKLQSNAVIHRKLTIPEGYTVHQVLALVDKADALTGELPTDIKEGSLFPETYYYTHGDSKASVVARMQQKQQEMVDALWQAHHGDVKNISSKEEMLILASIIEKETGTGSERARVSGVFHNRLKLGMMLQTDPTVLYAVSNHTGVLPRALTRKDLAVDSPYNTYKVAGLPPAPICNPGKASLEAAMNPLESKELYFVATGEGGHNFSETLNGHNNNVAKYKATLRKLRAAQP